MDIIKQLEWRYATKSFNSEKLVSDQDINTLVEAFNLTATSYGLQPIKLVVVKDKALQETLVPLAFNQKQVGEASHVLVFCIKTVMDTAFVNAYFDRIKAIRNTPDDILNPFKTFLINDFNVKSQDEKERWATKQAYLALGNLMTVCALLKIDACPMEGFMPKEFDEALQLSPLGLQSVLIMPIGYRSETDFMAALKKVRQPIADSVIMK